MTDIADDPVVPPAAPAAGGTRRSRLRTVALILFVVAGLAGLGGGGSLLAVVLTRPPASAEIAAAGRAEIASRWQRLPAGKIFPATIGYLTSDGLDTAASRVGIASITSCQPLSAAGAI